MEPTAYLIANADTTARMPHYAKHLRWWAENQGGLQIDTVLYRNARDRLFAEIDEFQNRGFNETLARLKSANVRAKEHCGDPKLLEERVAAAEDSPNKAELCLTRNPKLFKKMGCLHACLESDEVVLGSR